MKIESDISYLLDKLMLMQSGWLLNKMPDRMSYDKLKILFINIIAILYKATALNVHRLHSDLREVKVVVNTCNQEIWIPQLFIFLISGLLLMRFVMCFMGLASSIVAM